MRERIDFDRYLARVVTITNERGGRGYESGIRAFDCPWCGDTKSRGWMNVEWATAGCWNSGCLASPRLPGGAVEWVRQREGMPVRGAAWLWLLDRFPRRGASTATPTLIRQHDDWCTLPTETYWHPWPRLAEPVRNFLRRQWSIHAPDALVERWGLGWCRRGRHAGRLVIPITMRNTLVAFQTRALGAQRPKYKTSQLGSPDDPDAECGRPARAILFNLDQVRTGDTVVLVEGAGDVLAWSTRNDPRPAVALLGMNLSVEQLAMLSAAKPYTILVALDAEPEAERRALAYVDALRAWGLHAERGLWRGGKDAGTGATLDPVPVSDSVLDRVRATFR